MESSDVHSQQRGQDGGLSAEQQRQQDIRAFWRLRYPLQRQDMVRVAADSGHVQAQPTDLHSKHADTNPELPSRVCGSDNPAANEQLPRSVWQPGVVKRLANYIKHLREVDHESNKPHKPRKPTQSSEPHSCVNLPARACYCPRGVCADDPSTYRYAVLRPPSGEPGRVRTPEPNQLGNFRCPISGLACSKYACREWCESGVDYTKT